MTLPDTNDELGDGRPFGLFDAYGIELEYMIVDADTLDVAPIADGLIEAECGRLDNELARGRFGWSNELARHVIEIKTNGPVASLSTLGDGFLDEVRHVGERLRTMGARLLPTAMHPWMDPAREFQIWPHGDREVYAAFDRIFDCRGHGWANLQSMHVNLSFANDDEFGRLHAAIRALLPLLPGLAASSPYREGRASGKLDTRLDAYRTNAARIPSVSGAVVPEPIYTRAGYERMLASIYADLAPLDPEGILCHEWVNARGCIARFDRMALEIRVLDVQETPIADVAIAALVATVLRDLCDLRGAAQHRLGALDTADLARLLERTTTSAEAAEIEDGTYLEMFGLDTSTRTVGEVWHALIDRHAARDAFPPAQRAALEVLRDQGSLATRIRRRVGALSPSVDAPERDALAVVWRELADCLVSGRSFGAD